MANKIKISGCEPVKYGPHDFQLGDYVYAPVSLNDPSQGNQLAYIDQQDDEFCSIIFAQTGLTVSREYDDLCLVPITSIHAASEVIKKTYKITDEIRIGAQSPIKKDRYDPNEFVGFIVAVKILARGLDCRFMVKDSMYKQAETFEGAYRDLCVRNLDEIKKIYESKQKENDEK